MKGRRMTSATMVANATFLRLSKARAMGDLTRSTLLKRYMAARTARIMPARAKKSVICMKATKAAQKKRMQRTTREDSLRDRPSPFMPFLFPSCPPGFL